MQRKKIMNAVWIGLILVLLIIFYLYIDTGLNPTASPDENAVRIVAIGDSLTYGSGDPKKVGYIGRVQQQMNNRLARQIILYRYGVRGYRSDQIMVHIQNIEAKQHISQANYIFLFIGTNDFIQAARRDLNSINPEVMAQKRTLFEKNLTKLITQIRTDNQSSPLVLVGMYDPYTNFLNHDQLHQILNNWNKTTIGMTKKFPETYYVPTIDLFLHKEKEAYFSDVIHPNPRGYDLISKRVVDQMKKVGILK